jgi:DNA-binding MarR family transcriptional regulator
VTELDREANLLGALALVVTDRTSEAIAAAAGQSVTAAAALAALHEFLDRPTIERLRRVLGLTPSGTVRLVDRLEEAGYVQRGPGDDGRSRSVTLTRKGQRAAARIAASRAAVLSGALAGLSPADRATLHSLLGRLMGTFVRGNLDRRTLARGPDGSGVGWICRLCDLTACGRPEGRCPAANAAAAKLASA